MNQQVLFTLDLEDHLGKYSPTGRYIEISLKLLTTLAEAGIAGTVFTVGRVAQAAPSLIREISALGFEIGCHSLDHAPLDRQSPEEFRETTRQAKQILEDAAGTPIVGYRAPIFSLIKPTLWAVDVLHDLGFEYSSSVMPAANPLYGFPGAPAHAFKWHNGMVELPCPVGKFGPATLPFLGGIYLRYLPLPIIKSVLKRSDERAFLWTYCHPYDFDDKEPFHRFQDAPFWASVLLWRNRRNTLKKVRAITKGYGRTTMAEWVQKNAGIVPTYVELTPQPA